MTYVYYDDSHIRNYKDGVDVIELFPGSHDEVRSFKYFLKAGTILKPEKYATESVLYLFGGNPVASLFSGINNARMNLATFTAIGFLAGLAGLTIIMRVNSAKVGYGDAYVFQSLIVCVIAGIHPAGGRGKVIGIGLTVILMQMAASSFTILQLSPYTTKLIWGLMLILVLGLTKDGRRLLELIRSSFKKPSAKPLAKREES